MVDGCADRAAEHAAGGVAQLVALELEGCGGEVLDVVVWGWVVAVATVLARSLGLSWGRDVRWVREGVSELKLELAGVLVGLESEGGEATSD